MKLALRTTLGLLVCFAVVAAPNLARADDQLPSGKVMVAKTFRATKLAGLNVKDTKGEKLGTVDDFVINIETGKVAYMAMSVGGIMGLGDKLFAVPFGELKFDHSSNEMFFVLDVSKERLKDAPGFDKSNWPDFADPNWINKIDTYYRHAEVHTGATR